MIFTNQLSDATFHGTSTSQFSDSGRLNDDDMLVCGFSGETRSIDYGTFRNQILDDIYKTILGVKSMAYRSKSQYALSSHVHDSIYNTLSIGGYKTGDVQLFSVSNTGNASGTQTVTATTIRGEYPPEPKIGQLKFICVQRNVNINSQDFDGWVYADGTTYSGSRFSAAQAVYRPGWSTFTVPNLTGKFVKLSPDQRGYVQSEGHVLGMPDHYHGFQTMNNISLKLVKGDNMKIATYSTSDSKKKLPHQGKTASKVMTSTISFNPSQIKINPFYTSGPIDGRVDLESHPPYSQVMAMVYIGGRTKPYDEIRYPS